MAYERDSEEDLVWDAQRGEYVPASGEEYTLTIAPTPNDATVVLTADGYTQSGNSITVVDGTTVNYSVAKSGYTTVYGAVVVTETSSIPVTLTVARPIVEESSIGTTVYDIHSKATKNKNTANGADEYVYNWVGTLAQYTMQDIEHTHPDWVCLITDDEGTNAGIGNSYTRAETDALLATKTNKGYEVVEFQEPTSSNSYKWYYKYANGWVEQGGIVTISLTATATSCQWSTGNFPVTMQNSCYNYSLSELSGWIYSVSGGAESISTTAMGGWYQTSGGTVPRDLRITWRVEGMAA